MFNFIPRGLKLTLIFCFLACVSHLAYAQQRTPRPLSGVKGYAYKIGDTGPGGGFIFFVDYYDQYPGFTYLEAAPTDASTSAAWCSDTTKSIPAAAGWDANAVGRGRANTDAMLDRCLSGAANEADSYATGTTAPGDWFLPSMGEEMLMYTNLRQAGVGGFANVFYWSSTEYDSSSAWSHYFLYGTQYYGYYKSSRLRVRAVRAF
jgi:hypothetical protein